MYKTKFSWKDVKLSLLFASMMFVIMLTTMTLVFLGTHLLVYLGLVEGVKSERLPLFLFCIVSIIIGTLLAAIFSRRPLKPLREIMAATDKIADGDYSVRIDLKGPEEFKTLSQKFNHMAEEIGSVEILRSDFVNNFSHEFKTPIVSIRGFAKALKWDDLAPEEREEYLDIIISESERLSDLAANVLYLSKIETQTILTDKTKFNVSEQIRLVIALLDQKFLEKHIEIIFDCREFFIRGNQEMLKQVWINLLDNAIKFSPENGTVTIQIHQAQEHLVFRILDQGCGMSQETMAHIFDKFYQGDISHSTSGNGLGLAIVKKIVELHGGTVSVSSSGSGSTFEIKLPFLIS